jgi:hypothetical protein
MQTHRQGSELCEQQRFAMGLGSGLLLEVPLKALAVDVLPLPTTLNDSINLGAVTPER